MQDGALDVNNGVYTDLEDGVWWTNKISNPAPGSQSDPQPLQLLHRRRG